MKRRLLAGALWFLCGWYAGAALAWMLALNPVLAPVLAVAAGCLVLADPRGILWARTSPGTSLPSEIFAEAA